MGRFFGSSVIAISIAMLAAFYFFGIRPKRGVAWVMDMFERAVRAIAMVVLIIGAGGALMSGSSANPYLMAWLITVLIRLATGQGVVSAMTAAGIISAAVMDPATGTMMAGVNPALLVLATAAGSNTLTHINDASFWLFKGYFDLAVKDTPEDLGPARAEQLGRRSGCRPPPRTLRSESRTTPPLGRPAHPQAGRPSRASTTRSWPGGPIPTRTPGPYAETSEHVAPIGSSER